MMDCEIEKRAGCNSSYRRIEMKTETDIKIEQLHSKARGLLNSGMDEEDIISTFTHEDIDPAYAALIIQNIKSDNSDKTDFWKLLLMGSFFYYRRITCKLFFIPSGYQV